MNKQISELNTIQNLLMDAVNNKVSMVTKTELHNFMWHLWDKISEIKQDLVEIAELEEK